MKLRAAIRFTGITLILLTATGAAALYEASVTVKVVDEAEHPIPGIDVGITFERPNYKPDVWGSSEMFTKRGKSNAAGIFFATATSGNYVGYGADGAGYYKSRGSIEFKNVKDGRHQPWNPVVLLTLKKVVNPTSMYARRLEIEVPVLGEAAGFDLIESDWTAPFGRGKSDDVRFTITKKVTSFNDFAAELLISFGHKGSGIVLMPLRVQGGSELCSTHNAPDDGFADSLSLRQGNSKQGGSYGLNGQAENYFLRVRTLLDDRGQVVSALYGKIYGRIEFFPVSSKTAKLRFTYYLNPDPNDHNIEFDPKRNLFTNLKDLEKPAAP